jgi:surfactin synthase thioesterase subunit
VSGPLLVTWRPGALDGPVVLCLPPAGAGAGQVRGWQDRLGPAIGVAALQLPGREERWDEPPPASVDDVVDEAVDALLTRPPGVPLVVAGFSFGGLLGYEIARRLGAAGRPPRLLAVAACRPPGCWVGAGRGLADDETALRDLLDARELDELDEFDEDTREMLLAPLRDDARLSLTFAVADKPAVDCPLWTIGGERDTTVTADDLSGWRNYAAGPYAERVFSGGHYFWTEHDDGIRAELRTALERDVERTI